MARRRKRGWRVATFAIVACALAAWLFNRTSPATAWVGGYPYHGIDVSHHQGVIDWGQVASAQVDFAYIKATEGADYVDPTFAQNWRASAAAGLPRGAYHYFRLDSPGSAQLANLLKTVPLDDQALPIALDLELWGNAAVRPTTEAVQAELKILIDGIAKAYRRKPVLYVS